MEIACNAVKGFGKKKKTKKNGGQTCYAGWSFTRLHPAYNLKMNPTPTIFFFFFLAENVIQPLPNKQDTGY